jgi:hypothetical protein
MTWAYALNNTANPRRVRLNGEERFIKLAPQSAFGRAASHNLKRPVPELEQIRCQRAQILMDVDSSPDPEI